MLQFLLNLKQQVHIHFEKFVFLIFSMLIHFNFEIIMFPRLGEGNALFLEVVAASLLLLLLLLHKTLGIFQAVHDLIYEFTDHTKKMFCVELLMRLLHPLRRIF